MHFPLLLSAALTAAGSLFLTGCETPEQFAARMDAMTPPAAPQAGYQEIPVPESPPSRLSDGEHVAKGTAYIQVREAEEYRDRMRARAAQGDEEAQEWLNENSGTVDMMRWIYRSRERQDEEQGIQSDF